MGGIANTNESVISTRRGNAGSWSSMIGKIPFGQWELRLSDNQTNRSRALQRRPDVRAKAQRPGRRSPARYYIRGVRLSGRSNLADTIVLLACCH